MNAKREWSLLDIEMKHSVAQTTFAPWNTGLPVTLKGKPSQYLYAANWIAIDHDWTALSWVNWIMGHIEWIPKANSCICVPNFINWIIKQMQSCLMYVSPVALVNYRCCIIQIRILYSNQFFAKTKQKINQIWEKENVNTLKLPLPSPGWRGQGNFGGRFQLVHFSAGGNSR